MLVVAATATVLWFRHRTSRAREGIETEYSQPQSGPRVKLDAAAASKIRRDANPQLRFPEPLIEWPSFRGANRMGRVEAVRLAENRRERAPKELWRIDVGEAWSGIAVVGELVVTQEQRGDMEVVACYGLSDGQPRWTHSDTARLIDSQSRTGPRATPTCTDERVFTVGATGIVNCLDLQTGERLWTVNVAEQFDAELPTEAGMCSSPLLINDLVIVFVPGCQREATAAFEQDSGELRWRAGIGTESMSSPHWARFDQQEQVLMVSKIGVESFDPTTGERLWLYESPIRGITRILQPAVLDDGSFVLPTGQGYGVERVRVSREDGTWRTEMVWECLDFQPYLSDVTVADGCLHGNGDPVHGCLDLYTGQRLWKEGRHDGHVMLFPASDQQLVLARGGELILQELSREAFIELARVRVLGDDCLNHPAFAGDRLLVRNREQMACFAMPVSKP